MVSSEVILAPPLKLDNINKALAVRQNKEYAADYVPHLTIDDIRRLMEVVSERDKLLIALMFDGCLRVSEAISIKPQDIVKTPDGWQVRVLGKGHKRSAVALSASLVAQIQSFAYRNSIPVDALIFDVNRTRVHQIMQKAFVDANLAKPDGVGAVHILRHSGALERLKRTGNPKAVQDQLRHSSAQMTLRYMKTLSHQESMKIQQGIDLQW